MGKSIHERTISTFSKEICIFYEQGKSITEIANIYNCHRTRIWQILKKSGVKIISSSILNRKYVCNYDFFENIDNKNKAQILGFIAADGCNYRNEKLAKYQLILSVNERDLEYLKVLKQKINSDHKISTLQSFSIGFNKKPSIMKEFRISNKKISDDLIKLGISPRKSLVLQFPTNIPKKFIKDFIRGYFEGDGSIGLCKNRFEIKFSIASSQDFVIGLKKYIEKELKIKSFVEKYYKGNHYYFKIYNRDHIILFLEWIYKDFDFCMDRKYKKFLEVKNKLKLFRIQNKKN